MSNKLFQGDQQSPQTSLNITLDDLTDVKCDECGGEYFRAVALVKRLSPLVSPAGKEQIVPLQTFRCDDCGHANDIFMPK